MKQRYNIVFSNYDDIHNPYYGGGGAIAIHEVAKRLARKHNVTVVTGLYPGAVNEIIDGVEYERIGSMSFSPRVSQLLYHPALVSCMHSKDFDIWIESFTPPFSTSLLPMFTRKPVIGLVHMLSGGEMQRKYKLPFRWVEQLGLHAYKHCIVTTQEFRSTLESACPKLSVDVIPNGVQKPISSPETNGPKAHILFLGRIEVSQKGLDLLVRAYARQAKQLRYPLVIAGSGTQEEEQKLRWIIQKSGIKDRVRLAGRVQGKEKELLLRQAVCLVVPSRFETFSMVSLEGMALGIPVVAFDIDGLKWMPRQGVVKVESFDEDALAQAIHQTAERSAGERDQGDSFWKQYSWDAVARKYERCIRKNIEQLIEVS